ncbi:MAG: twin-arginine translocase TatA/TatE family subunit [bacterium]
MPGPTELIILLFIIVILFGAKKLPELAQGLGKGIREFKKASTEVEDATKLERSPEDKKTE